MEVCRFDYSAEERDRKVAELIKQYKEDWCAGEKTNRELSIDFKNQVFDLYEDKKMKFILTAREINNRGAWSGFCEKRGINEWAMAEGLMDPNEEFHFTVDQLEELGLQPFSANMDDWKED